MKINYSLLPVLFFIFCTVNKKLSAVVALAFLLAIQYAPAQSSLYISPGSNLSISSGTVFSTDSLSLVPSVNFNITGVNSETKNALVTHATSNPYIKRVFHFLANTTSFSGGITIYYQDAELNGIAENVLTLNVHNGTAWNAYTTGITRDATNNFVTSSGLSNIVLNELTLAGLSAPLPVNFILFNASCITSGIKLTWKTAQEFNSNNFEVQRSADAVTWQPIKSITAAGNSNTERSYSFTDNSSVTNSFYRIVEYDIDGKSTISFTLRSSCVSAESFAVYPNPVHDAALIKINVNVAATTVSLLLYDSKGALVKMMKTGLVQGNNRLQLNMRELANGWYHLITSWGNTVKEATIIKE